jgi:hypothetical protein
MPDCLGHETGTSSMAYPFWAFGAVGIAYEMWHVELDEQCCSVLAA